MSARHLLDDDDVLVVNKTLAKALGLNASIVFRQVNFWMKHNRKSKSERHFKDACWWTYNTYEKWQEENFEFWSYDTVLRTITGLEKLGLLFVGNYNTRKGDQTKWYTVNYGAYEAFMKLWADHAYPRAGDGRPSAAYKAFLEDWELQIKQHTNIASCIDQYSNLHRATTQLAQTVTRDYTETIQVDDAAPPPAPQEIPIVPFETFIEPPSHLSPAQLRSMGMVHALKPDSEPEVVVQIKATPEWAGFVKGHDGLIPDITAYDATLGLKAIEKLRANGAKPEDIEVSTRAKLKQKRNGGYRFIYLTTDVTNYLVQKRNEADPSTPNRGSLDYMIKVAS